MNLEQLMDYLKFAYRQKDAVYRVGRLASQIFSNGFSLKKVIATIIAFFEMFGCAISDTALTPLGEEINYDKYSLVFEDNFEGTSLNTDVWEYRGTGERRCGYNAESQVEVKDGNLIFTGEYLENGTFGPGWYTGMIKLKQQYCKGYFEIRCICNSGADFWSAFWFQADHPYDSRSNGGIGGAELDIFESMSSTEKAGVRGSVSQTIHCNTKDDINNLDSCGLGKFKGKNIYTEFNTYGLEWNDDEYIFYINGVESARSSWKYGVSEVPQELIVSLEIPDSVSYSTDSGHKTQFIVDYVKIYNIKPEYK